MTRVTTSVPVYVPKCSSRSTRVWFAPRSRGPRQQCSQADQVVRRGGEGHDPIDQLSTAVPQLAQAADRFHPAEDLFDELPFLLTDRVPRLARRPPVDRRVLISHPGELNNLF